MTRHHIVNPPTLPAAVGFAHAVVAADGVTVYLGGQASAQGPDGAIAGETVVDQFDLAAGGVQRAHDVAGGRPEDLVSLMIYVTDVADYRASLRPLGEVYRRHFGRHYPAMALFGVAELFDPRAKLELVATAVVPHQRGSDTTDFT